MEALTQRLPAHEGIAEPCPKPFRRHSWELRTAAYGAILPVGARLRISPHGCVRTRLALSKAIRRPRAVHVRIPAASAKWRYILPVAAVALVAGAILVGPTS